jgi:glycosyltransferase involved in cell wall biosynthesis
VLFSDQTNYKKVLIPVDEIIYNSKSRNKARNYFKLNVESKIIFFGASFTNEKRKGISLFIESLKKLKAKYARENKSSENIKVLIAGNQPSNQNQDEVFPFNTSYLGYIKESEIFSLAYQAADVFINCSIQDSGPMMINEAILCGTPVVTFNLGVANDLVTDGFSGFKIPIGNVDQMAEALYNILENYVSINNDAISHFGLEKTSYKNFQSNIFLEA